MDSESFLVLSNLLGRSPMFLDFVIGSDRLSEVLYCSEVFSVVPRCSHRF